MIPTLAILYNILTTPVEANQPGETLLATHTISMEKRYGNQFVNDVFRDNILLTISYLDGRVKTKNDINWTDINKPFHTEFTLKPGESFAFHELALPQYDKNIVKTTNAMFNYTDGFKSDGYLMGDGVCHLASLMYWVAKDAGLVAIAPKNHDFAVIPEVPKEYGVAIYVMPNNINSSGLENLYITNNKANTIKLVFDYDGKLLSFKIVGVR